ncbi:MAG: hypothetical protein ACRBN8_23640 [Nannocystales bacterium]
MRTRKVSTLWQVDERSVSNSVMHKIIVGVFNPGETPADNGRTIHALKLTQRLHAESADVELLFEGQGVQWLPRLTHRTEDSHPFDRHYGSVFDEVRSLARACNMCCIRFDVLDAVREAKIPILGTGREHVDIARYVLDGYQIINH